MKKLKGLLLAKEPFQHPLPPSVNEQDKEYCQVEQGKLAATDIRVDRFRQVRIKECNQHFNATNECSEPCEQAEKDKDADNEFYQSSPPEQAECLRCLAAEPAEQFLGSMAKEKDADKHAEQEVQVISYCLVDFFKHHIEHPL